MGHHYIADGNNPSESSTPPTITIGSGFSAEAPGPYGSPRFPWTVGNAITVNGSDVPIFVDPTENVVTVLSQFCEPHRRQRSNHASERAVRSGLRGHRQWCQHRARQCSRDLQQSAVLSVQSRQPECLDRALLPIQHRRLHLRRLLPRRHHHRLFHRRHSRRRTSIAGVFGLNAIVVSWSASAGASSYVVERSLDANTWSVIASGITATSFVDAGLAYSTIYYYRVLAVSSAGTRHRARWLASRRSCSLMSSQASR